MLIFAIVVVGSISYIAAAVAFPWLWRISVVNRTVHIRSMDMVWIALWWPLSIICLMIYVSVKAATEGLED